MKFACLWTPAWSTGAVPVAELGAALLALAPRVVVGRDVIWADAGGFRGERLTRLAEVLVERLAAIGVVGARAGVAAVPVVAELAAKMCAGGVVLVGRGGERDFLAPLPLSLLLPHERLRALLDGVGIDSIGALAALEREAVEVRFGAAGVALWRLARADDPRRIFGRIPRERPRASLDFGDYVLTDPARLIFTANALLGSICEGLVYRGEHARCLTLVLALANGQTWRKALRPARPTASRRRWLRLVRREMERLSVADAVAGVSIEVESTEPAVAVQGDLFDRGFETAGAVETALARLIDMHGPVIVEPVGNAHQLAERRVSWVPRSLESAVGGGTGLPAVPAHFPGSVPGAGAVAGAGAGAPSGVELTPSSGSGPCLRLRLLPETRRIGMEAEHRRDHLVPLRFHDEGQWRELISAAGPDRLSGERWGAVYAREYYRCVTDAGSLVWIFRDARNGDWFFHGWWD